MTVRTGGSRTAPAIIPNVFSPVGTRFIVSGGLGATGKPKVARAGGGTPASSASPVPPTANRDKMVQTRIVLLTAALAALCTIALFTACPAALAQDSADSSASWYEKGLKFLDTTRYDEAIDCFDRAIDMDPNNEKALFARGSTLLVVGRFEDAYQDLNRALAIDPADAGAYYVRGLVYEEANNYENATADYGTALTIDPHNGDYLFRRGRAYREMGKTDEAIADFRRACELGYVYVCDELKALLKKDGAN